MAVSEAKLPLDIAFSVFEDQNRSFIDLNGEFFVLSIARVINIRFLACRNAAIDLADHAIFQKLVEDNARARI